MVDWCPQDALDLLAHYGLRQVTTAFSWIKTNGDVPLDIWNDSSWHMGQGIGPAPTPNNAGSRPRAIRSGSMPTCDN
jgi:hypothetical protein